MTVYVCFLLYLVKKIMKHEKRVRTELHSIITKYIKITMTITSFFLKLYLWNQKKDWRSESSPLHKRTQSAEKINFVHNKKKENNKSLAKIKKGDFSEATSVFDYVVLSTGLWLAEKLY